MARGIFANLWFILWQPDDVTVAFNVRSIEGPFEEGRILAQMVFVSKELDFVYAHEDLNTSVRPKPIANSAVWYRRVTNSADRGLLSIVSCSMSSIVSRYLRLAILASGF